MQGACQGTRYARYMQPSAMSGVAFANKPGATSFDLDYMIFDEEKGICLIGIREVGGNRQLSFGTGYCEAVVLDVALQPVTSPRPLTHHAMVFTYYCHGAAISTKW